MVYFVDLNGDRMKLGASVRLGPGLASLFFCSGVPRVSGLWNRGATSQTLLSSIFNFGTLESSQSGLRGGWAGLSDSWGLKPCPLELKRIEEWSYIVAAITCCYSNIEPCQEPRFSHLSHSWPKLSQSNNLLPVIK